MRWYFVALATASVLVSACVTPSAEPPAVEPSTLSEKDAEIEKLERWVQELRALQTLDEVASAPMLTPAQIETFGALTDFVGKSFKGTPGGGEDAKADIQKWSWALGGNAILIQHAIEDGSYGGDTYVYKDAATDGLVYVYITNAGFRTEGTMTVSADGTYTAEEAVEGHPSITMVRSTSRLNEDGSTSMTSEYLDIDVWTPGHSFTYRPTTDPLPDLTPPVLKQ